MVSAHHGVPDGGGGSGARREETADMPPVSRLLSRRPPPIMALPRASTDDPGKKIRKPYTITKSREGWTKQEHDKFLEALHLFDRDWKKIEAFVGSKTAIQIRSHAQKYFLKVQKNGTSEHVPPPRPKRKAAHPYPQKAPKNGQQLPQGTASLQVSCLLEPGYALAVDFSSTPGNYTSKAPMHSKDHSCLQPVAASQQTADDTRPAELSTTNNCSTSTICLTTWPTSETADGEKLSMAPHVMPDFARVYSFLGNVFEPGSTGHLEKLKEMDPIDAETVLLLMRNLAINLISPDYESHITLLSSSNSGPADMKFAIANNIFSAC